MPVALHDYHPRDETTDVADTSEGGFQPLTAPGFDPSKLNPKFTERLYGCPTCQDTAFEVVSVVPFGVRPCGTCMRGDAVFNGWWKEAREQREKRGTGQEPNRVLHYVDPGEDVPF